MPSILATLNGVPLLASHATADPVIITNPAIPANLPITPVAKELTFPYGLYWLPRGSFLAAPGIRRFEFAGFAILYLAQTNRVENASTAVFSSPANPGLSRVLDIGTVASGTNAGRRNRILLDRMFRAPDAVRRHWLKEKGCCKRGASFVQQYEHWPLSYAGA